MTHTFIFTAKTINAF